MIIVATFWTLSERETIMIATCQPRVTHCCSIGNANIAYASSWSCANGPRGTGHAAVTGILTSAALGVLSHPIAPTVCACPCGAVVRRFIGRSQGRAPHKRRKEISSVRGESRGSEAGETTWHQPGGRRKVVHVLVYQSRRFLSTSSDVPPVKRGSKA